MTDTLTSDQRHRCMSHIHSKGTKPELLVRRWLWSNGYRYRLNVKSVPGKPDIVMRRYRTAIFINGCFWHGHEGCKYYRIPKSNTEFWENKISNNRIRDQKNYDILQRNGWQVIVVWECQLAPSDFEHTMREVDCLLNDKMLSKYRNKSHANASNEQMELKRHSKNKERLYHGN